MCNVHAACLILSDEITFPLHVNWLNADECGSWPVQYNFVLAVDMHHHPFALFIELSERKTKRDTSESLKWVCCAQDNSSARQPGDMLQHSAAILCRTLAVLSEKFAQGMSQQQGEDVWD